MAFNPFGNAPAPNSLQQRGVLGQRAPRVGGQRNLMPFGLSNRPGPNSLAPRGALGIAAPHMGGHQHGGHQPGGGWKPPGGKPSGPQNPALDAQYFLNVAANQFRVNNAINGLDQKNAYADTDLQNALANLGRQQPLDNLKAEQSANQRGSLFSTALGQQLGQLNTSYLDRQSADQSNVERAQAGNNAQISALQGSVPIYDAGQYLAAVQRASLLAQKNPASGESAKSFLHGGRGGDQQVGPERGVGVAGALPPRGRGGGGFDRPVGVARGRGLQALADTFRRGGGSRGVRSTPVRGGYGGGF